MSEKNKILFLAYYFPPCPTIASVRCGSIARYLAKRGWDVNVITPHPKYWRGVINAEIEDVEKEMMQLGIIPIYTKHNWRYLVSHLMKCYDRGLGWFCKGVSHVIAETFDVDSRIGWRGPAFKAGKSAAANGVDLILASGGPWCAFELARKLSISLSRPYVLDYRDLWTTGNPHISFQSSRAKSGEYRAVSDCAALFAVSRSMADNLSEEFHLAEKVHVVTNGYDPIDLAEVKKTYYDHFALVYTGVILPPKRHLWPIMRGLREIERIRSGSNWRLHYYGPSSELVRAVAKENDVEDKVDIHGVVPRAKAIEAVHGADAAVVVTSVYDESSLEDRGIITGKIFEAIGLGTPIIVIAPPGSDVEDVVHVSGMGRVFRGSDTNGIVGFMCDLMDGHKPIRRQPETYAWPNLISKMDDVLQSVLSNTRSKTAHS